MQSKIRLARSWLIFLALSVSDSGMLDLGFSDRNNKTHSIPAGELLDNVPNLLIL